MPPPRPPPPPADSDPEWTPVVPDAAVEIVLRRLGHDLRNAAGAGGCSPGELLQLALLAECAATLEGPVPAGPASPWIEQVEAALDGTRWLRRRRSVELNLQLPPESRLVSAPDEICVRRALDLLLLQALTSTPGEGSLRVQVLEGATEVGLELDADFPLEARDGLWASTRPTGPRPRLEELVLRTVARALSAAGGRVELHRSSATSPVRVALRLPVAHSATPSPPAGPASGADLQPAGGGRILVVDDNHDAARTLSLCLSLQGLDVHTVYHGRDALLQLVDPSFAAVLLDLGLPDMDGYEVAHRTREELGRRDLLLVAVSGYGDADAVARTTEVGFDHHLVKPVDEEQLCALLRRRGLLR